jgi:hypothetical protein
VNRKTHCKEEPRKIMARLANAGLLDGNFYNFFWCN